MAEPVSYTHLDVYKRQLLGDADDHHHHNVEVAADAEPTVTESHSAEPSTLAR